MCLISQKYNGIPLSRRNMDWNEELLKDKLAGKLIGHKVYYYPSISSTNDEAYRLGMEGAPEGTVVIADMQTKGKGRLQRVWHSPAGTNIYTSIILRPQIKTATAPQISLVAGVAVAELLDQFCPDRVELKWPNDVLINGKKICGILAQMKTEADQVGFVVVGIGINVNIRPDQFPVDIVNIATSLSIQTGRENLREDLIISLYENFAKWYKKLLQDGFTSIKERWLHYAAMVSLNVQVSYFNETLTGKALGIDDSGALILLDPRGATINVTAGDATILKE
jgi:BirA family transcriptional regulator, biotin operon repressor / biotin---[acetyl-CoA-carboxylase] ligase